METIITILTAVVAGVAWLVRLESKAKANALKSNQNGDEIKLMKTDFSVFKEQHNETKLKLAVIEKSVSTIEDQNKVIIQMLNTHMFKSPNG